MLDKFKTVCADCGYHDVTWAVINRGLLICDQCCSVHRSLGRHISQLKSLNKGHWRASQLNMVQTLNNGSINSLWEHSLSDAKCSKKKPLPTDPLHPHKTEFIRAKHQDLAYIMKCWNSDSSDDLNQQLHSSVRTTNLETSLRLLIQGADPNYYHSEKGSCVIHVAASAGQMEQVELLISYGADPNAIDCHGNNVIACARNHGIPEINDKIIDCIYEVTDTFCSFLCNRRPDHKTEHFFVPDVDKCNIALTPNPLIYARLQQLSNTLFEELVMDVFDEVDRRENEAIFESSVVTDTNRNLKEETLVPFLPVNPDLSTMRNQGRQKLARLSASEFATLVWDILADCRRRQNARRGSVNKINIAAFEDEPLYDTVASDDDYATAEELANHVSEIIKSTKEESVVVKDTDTIKDEVQGDLKTRLTTSEIRISELVSQVVELQKKMDEMKKENIELRNTIHHRQEKSDEQDQAADVKPRPTSLYNIAQRYINDSSSSSMDRISLPEPDEVFRKANQVTKRLQELSKTLRSIEYYGAFTPCVENVRTAVSELCAIFPQEATEEAVRTALRTLNTNTIRLQAVCIDVDAAIDKMRNCAFNMAKANRQILTHFQC